MSENEFLWLFLLSLQRNRAGFLKMQQQNSFFAFCSDDSVVLGAKKEV